MKYKKKIVILLYQNRNQQFSSFNEKNIEYPFFYFELKLCILSKSNQRYDKNDEHHYKIMMNY